MHSVPSSSISTRVLCQSAYPIKANTRSTQGPLTRRATMASTSSATSSSAAALAVTPKGWGDTVDAASIRVSNLKLCSLSPEKRDFLRQQTPVSPTKRILNSDFTGRTSSEGEQVLKDKANGLAIRPPPEQKINEVPWTQGTRRDWCIDWEIAEELAQRSGGKHIRKLTDEEKTLLSPAKPRAQAPLVTPLKTAGFAASTPFSPVKETQTVIRTSK
ncbi:hypothetical protein EV426DRAFT_143495 [Tirmania nivea]|nr:hypothetical protein EV426DRAFT_143495 [Tirmania nivea]